MGGYIVFSACNYYGFKRCGHHAAILRISIRAENMTQMNVVGQVRGITDKRKRNTFKLIAEGECLIGYNDGIVMYRIRALSFVFGFLRRGNSVFTILFIF